MARPGAVTRPFNGQKGPFMGRKGRFMCPRGPFVPESAAGAIRRGLLPFYDEGAIDLLTGFERTLYSNLQ